MCQIMITSCTLHMETEFWSHLWISTKSQNVDQTSECFKTKSHDAQQHPKGGRRRGNSGVQWCLMIMILLVLVLVVLVLVLVVFADNDLVGCKCWQQFPLELCCQVLHSLAFEPRSWSGSEAMPSHYPTIALFHYPTIARFHSANSGIVGVSWSAPVSHWIPA